MNTSEEQIPLRKAISYAAQATGSKRSINALRQDAREIKPPQLLSRQRGTLTWYYIKYEDIPSLWQTLTGETITLPLNNPPADEKPHEQAALNPKEQQPTFIGTSQAIQTITENITRAARFDYNILITGETGVGKEITAHEIHRQSTRANKPYIAVNCAGLTESLLEAELFGHDQNSFTGAARTGKKGKIEIAHHGTLFLDEVADLSEHGQRALLRALENRTIYRIGAISETPVNFRLICATNKNPTLALQEGTLREDFYHRINTLPIHIPPLRERKEDIPLLCNYFITKYCTETGIPQKTFTPSAIETLTTHPWPGNIRELENIMKRLIIYVDEPIITDAHLQQHLQQKAQSTTIEDILKHCFQAGITPKAYEHAAIQHAMNQSLRNQTKAARLLGISRDQIRYRLAKYEKEQNSSATQQP